MRGAHTVWRTFLGGVPPFWWISGLGTQHPCCMCGCISSFLLSTWSCAQSVAGCRLAGYLSAPRHVLWPHPLRLFYPWATEHIQLHLTTSKLSLILFTALLLQEKMDQSRFLSLFQSVRVKVVKKYVVDLPGVLWAKTRYIEQNNHMHFTFAYVLVVCQHEKTFHCINIIF